jgi:hypothetical protein
MSEIKLGKNISFSPNWGNIAKTGAIGTAVALVAATLPLIAKAIKGVPEVAPETLVSRLQLASQGEALIIANSKFSTTTMDGQEIHVESSSDAFKSALDELTREKYLVKGMIDTIVEVDTIGAKPVTIPQPGGDAQDPASDRNEVENQCRKYGATFDGYSGSSLDWKISPRQEDQYAVYKLTLKSLPNEEKGSPLFLVVSESQKVLKDTLVKASSFRQLGQDVSLSLEGSPQTLGNLIRITDASNKDFVYYSKFQFNNRKLSEESSFLMLRDVTGFAVKNTSETSTTTKTEHIPL